jgi:hypothetical protein
MPTSRTISAAYHAQELIARKPGFESWEALRKEGSLFQNVTQANAYTVLLPLAARPDPS